MSFGLNVVVVVALALLLGRPVAGDTWYDPKRDVLLWIHIPKNAGGIIAAQAFQSAKYHNEKIAFCYTAQGQPQCNVPTGMEVAGWMGDKANWYGRWNPMDKSKPPPDHIYGHGVRYGSHVGWKLQKQPRYIIVMRHPMSRLVATFGQLKKAPEHPLHNAGFSELFDVCIRDDGRMPNGDVEFFATSPEYGVSPESWSKRRAEATKLFKDPNVMVLLQEELELSFELLQKAGVMDPKGTVELPPYKETVLPRGDPRLMIQGEDIAKMNKCYEIEMGIYVSLLRSACNASIIATSAPFALFCFWDCAVPAFLAPNLYICCSRELQTLTYLFNKSRSMAAIASNTFAGSME